MTEGSNGSEHCMTGAYVVGAICVAGGVYGGGGTNLLKHEHTNKHTFHLYFRLFQVYV